MFGQLQLNTQFNPIRYHGENRIDENNSGTHYALNTPVIFGNSQGENDRIIVLIFPLKVRLQYLDKY